MGSLEVDAGRLRLRASISYNIEHFAGKQFSKRGPAYLNVVVTHVCATAGTDIANVGAAVGGCGRLNDGCAGQQRSNAEDGEELHLDLILAKSDKSWLLWWW